MFIEAKDDGGGGDNWTTGAISRAKLQSNCYHQQTNTQLLQAGCPSCCSTNSVKALKVKCNCSTTTTPIPTTTTNTAPGSLLSVQCRGPYHATAFASESKTIIFFKQC